MVVDPGLPTLAEALASAGYQTAGFVSAAVLHSDYGICRGFDVWNDDMDSGHEVNKVAGPKILSDEVTERAIAWLSGRRSSSRFFLFIHYFDPHTPENVPQPWLGKYPFRNDILVRILYHKLGFKSLDPHWVLARRNSWYYGAVSYTDHWIGELLSTLEKNGLYDDTLIILTADHGEGLGDHAWVDHAAFLYEEIVNVPLIIKLPGQRRAGTSVDDLTGHVDLMPTVLDAAGIPSLGPMSGQSLWAGTLEGQPVGGDRVFGQRQHYEPGQVLVDLKGREHVVRGEQFFVRTPRHKLIAEEDGRSELFDLSRDPGELRNLAKDRPEIARDLARELEEWKAAHPPVGESVSKDDELTLRRLRSLGYLD
jgi:arylsulfatase A-like enzyme